MKLWRFFATLVTVIRFLAFNGLQAIVSTLRDVFVSMMQDGVTSIDPKSLIIVVVVLFVLSVR